MADFILFGTEGCHLCDEAEVPLSQTGLPYEKQDIAGDEQLLLRYAVRIPVLLHKSSRMELGWPFSIEQLMHFVAQSTSP
ncbi:glutaredoxin family protein [Methylomonas sp. MgM2]